MNINYKIAESFIKPERTEQVTNGYYVRRNYSTVSVVDEQNPDAEPKTKYVYEEAFLTPTEFNYYLMQLAASQEDTSDAYLRYKEKLDTPVIYPKTGFAYKPKWVKDAMGKDGTYMDLYNKGLLFPDFVYPIPLYDATEDVEKLVTFTKEEFVELIGFLAAIQQQFYNEYKAEKAQEV